MKKTVALWALLPFLQGGSAAFAQSGCPHQVCASGADAYAVEVEAVRQRMLARLTPVTAAMLTDPPAADWLSWRRTENGFGYSPLDEISKANASQIHLAWSWAMDAGPNVSTPLVHDGVLFVQNVGDRVQALDAATGDLLWTYNRVKADPAERPRGKKSLAIFEDKLFIATEDEHLVALDIRSGKLIWDQQVAGVGSGYHYSGGPIIAHGKVIAGISGCVRNQPGGCFISGHDPATGKELWRFSTIARVGEPGGDTWGDLPLAERRGGAVWMPGTYDPELNLVFFGTGQATPYNAAQRRTAAIPGKGGETLLYTDSTLALNPDTGKLVWHYQHLPNDTWDMDYSFERMILTLPVNGKPRKLVLTIGKPGIIEMVDAATGKFVAAHDLGIQNIITVIDPVTGAKTIDPIRWATRTDKTLSYCPGASGARNWPATSYDPIREMLYVPMNDHCATASVVPLETGEVYSGGAGSTYLFSAGPKSGGKVGLFQAIDLNTMTSGWSYRERAPQGVGALATAGGVVFGGSIDRYFRAFDADSGRVLWQTRLAATPNSLPITYSAGGRQFVAVMTGSGTTFAGSFGGMLPDLNNPSAASATLWVFALGKADQK